MNVPMHATAGGLAARWDAVGNAPDASGACTAADSGIGPALASGAECGLHASGIRAGGCMPPDVAAPFARRPSRRERVPAAERSVEACHLHFNGPGAAGFGVKRTAMLLPESVMLLVAPGCCGRHGTITAGRLGFEDRMFYLQLEPRDIATGSYLKRIPEACRLAVEAAHPRALFLCMTCIDALLGTDLESIGRKMEPELGIPVVGCFMDPIAREGRRAPMVSVQQAVMQCLKPLPMRMDAVNILGGFVPVDAESELHSLLAEAGVTTVRQISGCADFDEYLRMAEARLNIVIHPQAEASARDMQEKLGIPYVMWGQAYSPAATAAEYECLGAALGVAMDVRRHRERAEERLRVFARAHKGMRFVVGEAVNGSPVELACTLKEAGLDVRGLFRTIILPGDREPMRRLAAMEPGMPVFSGVHPSMAGADFSWIGVDAAIGLDAGYFWPEAVSICWNMERQALGFEALAALLDEVEKNLASPVPHRLQMHGSYLVV